MNTNTNDNLLCKHFALFHSKKKWQNCKNLWMPRGFSLVHVGFFQFSNLALCKSIRKCSKTHPLMLIYKNLGKKKNAELKILLCCSIWTKISFQIENTSHNLVSTLLSFFPWHFAQASISCSKTSLAAYQLTNPWPLRQAPSLTCLPTHAINTCMRSSIIPKQHCNRWDCKDTIFRKAAPYKSKHYYSDY